MADLREEMARFDALLRRGPSGAALAVSDTGRGRWITIGGVKGQDGKRHGGSPVYIEGGRITKGAPSLTGKKIDALKEEDESTHRQQLHREKGYSRAKAAKEAKAEGIDPNDLHGLAADMLAHDREHSQERDEVLTRAKDLFRHYGYDAAALTTNLRSGRVEDQPRHLDEVADSLARSYPHQFAGQEDAGERLLDLFREGKPQRMTEQQAYEAAREQLREHRRAYEAEAAPFSVGLSTPSPVIPEIPDYLKHHEDPDTRANNFEARSLGQRERTDRPPAKPRYTLQQGKNLVTQLRARKQAAAAAAPPVQPPSPHEPIQAPRLLQAQQGVGTYTAPTGASTMPEPDTKAALEELEKNNLVPRRDEDEEDEGDEGDDLAAAVAAVQESAAYTVTDEELASTVIRQNPALWGKDESWSAFLRRVRAAGADRAGGVEQLRPKKAGSGGDAARKAPPIVEESMAGFSAALAVMTQPAEKMSEERRQQVVGMLMRERSGGPPAPPAAAFSMGAYQTVVSGMSSQRAAQVVGELEKNGLRAWM